MEGNDINALRDAGSNMNEPPRHRRPLPTPVVTPASAAPPNRPNTPVEQQNPPFSTPQHSNNSSSVMNPPPLPSRPKGVGSSHTTAMLVPDPESEKLPTFDDVASWEYIPNISYREPELVKAADHVDNKSYYSNTYNPVPGPDAWTADQGGSWGTTDNMVDWSKGFFDNQPNYDGVTIDGRSNTEELGWWNPDIRATSRRPGPGMLPTVLAEQLHDANHTLYSISVKCPTFSDLTASLAASSSQAATSSTKGALNATQTTPSVKLDPNSPPPADTDVRTAIPHPNAHYCPKENGWVLLIWTTSKTEPPFARSFQQSEDHFPLPSNLHRRKTNCIPDGSLDHNNNSVNQTHHFHKYPKSIDSLKLLQPYHKDEWDTLETLKHKRRAGTLLTTPVDIEKMRAEEAEDRIEDDQHGEGLLLDLYMCCQCSFYVIASDVIPGVIDKELWQTFIRDKKDNPPLGKGPTESVVTAVETLLLAIENRLWKGESRLLRVDRPKFRTKMGWNEINANVFATLGFRVEAMDTESSLRPPTIDVRDAQGRQNRKKLLRAWIEMGAWLTDFLKSNKPPESHKNHKLWVTLDGSRESYQTAIGAHPDQIQRNQLEPWLHGHVEEHWSVLGMTGSSYSEELLAFAYLAQCRCDPARTMQYFTAFDSIISTLEKFQPLPALLHDLQGIEKSRERFTFADVAQAAHSLGFGTDGPLRLEYDDDIDDDFLINAYQDCIRRSWIDPSDDGAGQRNASDAFKILADARGSLRMRHAWEESKGAMNPDRAYNTLEVPKEVDDSMLITIYNMRVEEQPHELDKMKEALHVIATVRDSDRLRQFLATGIDPDTIVNARPDWPRGLNQLGNTCYLNSLLQYFYTIKELREEIQGLIKLDIKTLDDDKLSEEDLKRHRVGGRLVTRREIMRSRKFVNQLAELFHKMEYSEDPSVTPSTELAKLALVTSKDEEEEEVGTDSSNDTDATLVEDSMLPRYSERSSSPPVQLSPMQTTESVLGKRPRQLNSEKSDTLMDVDEDKENAPPQGTVVPSMAGPSSSSASLDPDGDVLMRSSTPLPKKVPPLPPRKTDSMMMFGRQHDVAECMDNCMFQIETALLRFDDINDVSASAGMQSVVKRLFYGKIKQRLGVSSDPSKSAKKIEPKEEVFSQIPVNVGEDGFDIYDGLGRYFDDIVDYEGQRVPMQLSLLELPPLLQIQLQRVQFNRDTLQSWKSQAYVKFEETIYMDRFMESADKQKRAQSKVIQENLNAGRERLKILTQRKDGAIATAIENTCKFLTYLEGENLDTDLISALQAEKAYVEAEIEALRQSLMTWKQELEAIWKDDKNYPYELTSVFIHRGVSPSWGHYFFYSRNLPDEPDQWFMYNDSDVSTIAKEEVLADTTGSTANPYLLVFARKGSQIIDTVKRFDASILAPIQDKDLD